MNIIHLVSNKEWGGGERYALDLCRALEADGHSVAVVTRGIEAVDRHFISAGFTPGHLPLGGIFDFVSPSRLSSILNRIEGPVVIHVHNFKDARTAVKARRMASRPDDIRIVVTRHLVKAAKTDRTSRELYNSLDAIVFVSHTAKDKFLSSNPRIDAGRLHVVHNALLPHPSEEPCAREEDEFRVVFVGRLVPDKGLETAIEALVKLPDSVKLHIAGTGTPAYSQRLLRLAKALAVDRRIVWHGHMADPYPLQASACVGIVPSVAAEAFGLAALELMACGVPVIASDIGALREVVRDGIDGRLVPAADADSLADAIASMANGTADTVQMGQAARQRALTDFGYDAFFNKIKQIYRG